MSILPDLDRQLHEAAARRLPATPPASVQSPRRSPRRRIRRVGSLAGVLTVLIAVAVAVSALLLIKGSRNDQPLQRSGSPTTPARLLSAFGVLRRHQTPADLNPRLISLYLYRLGSPSEPRLPRTRLLTMSGPDERREGYPELVRSLLRVVRVPRSGAQVLIAPTSYRPSLASQRRTIGLNLVLGNTGTGPRPTSLPAALGEGILLFGDGSRTANDGVALVPDRVASVSLSDFRTAFRHRPRGFSPASLDAIIAPIHAASPVTENIAGFRVEVPTWTPELRHGHVLVGALLGVPVTAQETWRDTSGRIVRQTTCHTSLNVRIR